MSDIRPSLAELKELIKAGPDPGSVTVGKAKDWNVVYPQEYNGPVPLEDNDDVRLINGVPIPLSYADAELQDLVSK